MDEESGEERGWKRKEGGEAGWQGGRGVRPPGLEEGAAEARGGPRQPVGLAHILLEDTGNPLLSLKIDIFPAAPQEANNPK